VKKAYKVECTCAVPGCKRIVIEKCTVITGTEKEARFIAYQTIRDKYNVNYIKVISVSFKEIECREERANGAYDVIITEHNIEEIDYKIYVITVQIKLRNETYEIKYEVGAVNEEVAKSITLSKIKKVLGISNIWMHKEPTAKEVRNYEIRNILNLDFQFLKIREITNFHIKAGN